MRHIGGVIQRGLVPRSRPACGFGLIARTLLFFCCARNSAFGIDDEARDASREAAKSFMEWLRTDDASEEEIDISY